MKKKLYMPIVLTAALAIALLTGCTSTAGVPSVTTIPAATPIPDTQNAPISEAYAAYESSETLTPEEIAAQQREREDEIERTYAIYAPFGLTYDREKDLFFYNGKTVRYFKDVVDIWSTNGFFYESGVLDLTAERDDTGELTGLVQATQTEFDARTAEHEKREKEFAGAVGEVSEAVSYESADPHARDHSFDPYKPYGVSYDEAAKTWMFASKPIHLFYDGNGGDGLIYTNESVTEGINVQVIRDSAGEIVKLTEMTEADIQKITE